MTPDLKVTIAGCMPLLMLILMAIAKKAGIEIPPEVQENLPGLLTSAFIAIVGYLAAGQKRETPKGGDK